MNIDELVKVIRDANYEFDVSNKSNIDREPARVRAIAEAISREFPCMRKWHTYDRGSGPCVDCGQTKEGE